MGSKHAGRLFAGLLGSIALTLGITMTVARSAEEAAKPEWKYNADLMRPFWQGTVMEGESVLFLKDPKTGVAQAAVLFPVDEVLTVTNSAGDVKYENGKDYVWKPGTREFVLPEGSRIVSHTPDQLRRPAKTQKYELTQRDGNGEVYFGSRLEYAEMQTCITYKHAPDLFKGPVPKVDQKALPRAIHKLVNKLPLSIVLVGDSISAGCNASGWAGGAPYQPQFSELLRQHLAARYRGPVTLANPSKSGTDSLWVLGAMDKVVEPKPDLVIIAFGMNDSAGRSAQDYQANTKAIIAKVREHQPNCEFILVASMLGNKDWVRLKQELFPAYRDALAALVEPGVAIADLTSIWTEFLKVKKDCDQTGNGVNHPNDFGHRVYAQVLATLLETNGDPTAEPQPVAKVESGPLEFAEERLLGNYTYSYACVAADLDGDGDLDLTSSDAEPNSNLYLLLNDGKGHFTHSFIQKYASEPNQPIRLERHAIGDINRDGHPDVVIVDNLKWAVRWFENPGPANITKQWKLHDVSAHQEVPGAYDVALSDFDADGDLDVAASSWVHGNRFDWFENVGAPGTGEKFVRHEIAGQVPETRTVAVADFNRDGKPDFLGTSRAGHQILWYANPANPLSDPWAKTVIDDKTLAPTHGHPADMDGDGDLDVLMAFGLVAPAVSEGKESHQVAWYENVGKPGLGAEWKKHLISTNLPQGFEAVAGDLDGDGDQDVVATGWTPSGRITWFENTGDPKAGWKQHALKNDWPNAVTVIIADMDKDGRLDIVGCAERGANELRWWRNVRKIPAKP